MEKECENAILEYAPIFRQVNAALLNEHRDYVETVLVIHRNHYHQLIEKGETQWRELPAEIVQWLNENRPY